MRCGTPAISSASVTAVAREVELGLAAAARLLDRLHVRPPAGERDRERPDLVDREVVVDGALHDRGLDGEQPGDDLPGGLGVVVGELDERAAEPRVLPLRLAGGERPRRRGRSGDDRALLGRRRGGRERGVARSATRRACRPRARRRRASASSRGRCGASAGDAVRRPVAEGRRGGVEVGDDAAGLLGRRVRGSSRRLGLLAGTALELELVGEAGGAAVELGDAVEQAALALGLGERERSSASSAARLARRALARGREQRGRPRRPLAAAARRRARRAARPRARPPVLALAAPRPASSSRRSPAARAVELRVACDGARRRARRPPSASRERARGAACARSARGVGVERRALGDRSRGSRRASRAADSALAAAAVSAAAPAAARAARSALERRPEAPRPRDACGVAARTSATSLSAAACSPPRQRGRPRPPHVRRARPRAARRPPRAPRPARARSRRARRGRPQLALVIGQRGAGRRRAPLPPTRRGLPLAARPRAASRSRGGPRRGRPPRRRPARAPAPPPPRAPRLASAPRPAAASCSARSARSRATPASRASSTRRRTASLDRATSAARIRSCQSRARRRAAAAAARAAASAARWCSSRGVRCSSASARAGQLVALGDERLHARLELRAAQLERVERPQRLGGHARLRLLGRLGPPRPALGHDRAVDDLAARLLGLVRRLDQLDHRRGALVEPRRHRQRRALAARPLEPDPLRAIASRQQVGAAPQIPVPARARRVGQRRVARHAAADRRAQLGSPSGRPTPGRPPPAHAHEPRLGARGQPLDAPRT